MSVHKPDKNMVKTKNLTKKDRIKVMILHEGYPGRQIALTLKCNHSTVARLIKKVNETGQGQEKIWSTKEVKQ